MARIHISDPEYVASTKLQAMRLKRGMSQSQLAKESGISVRVIQNYERKATSIDLAGAGAVYKLALALKCGIADILEEEY